MGFGNRLQNSTPGPRWEEDRGRIWARARRDERLDISRAGEIALADDFFVSRKLYPNVDFYTGLIYKAMGFPTKMFTVLFGIGRLPGWIAQWREMINDKQTKIGRPRQVYTGATERDYLAVTDR